MTRMLDCAQQRRVALGSVGPQIERRVWSRPRMLPLLVICSLGYTSVSYSSLKTRQRNKCRCSGICRDAYPELQQGWSFRLRVKSSTCNSQRKDPEATMVYTFINIPASLIQKQEKNKGGDGDGNLDLSCVQTQAISVTRAHAFHCAVLPEASFSCCMLFIIFLSFALVLFNSFPNSAVYLRSLEHTNTATYP